MDNSTGRRIGLVIFGLLSVGDITGIFFTDGDNPPYAVAAVSALLGLVSIVLVVQAWRDHSRSLRLLTGLRVLSAVTAIPAFFVSDVPAGIQVMAAAIIVLTAIGVVLTARPRTAAVTS
jgi:hypothetical protein